MNYSITYRWARLKNIPKLYVILWFFILFLTLFSFIRSAIPWSYYSDKTEEKTIEVTDVTLFDSRDIKGSRFRLSIRSEDSTFYLWYPVETYLKYKNQVEASLLSGDIVQVSIRYQARNSFRDIILNQHRIIDLRFNELVFYDIQDEELRFQSARFSYFFLGIVLFIIFLVNTFLLCIIYGVLLLKKRSKTGDGVVS